MEFWPLALIAVIIGISLFVIAKLRKRNDMSQHCDDPNKLFRELSIAHQLDKSSQKLLLQLAQAMQLAQPAEIFLQPAYFEAAQLPTQLRNEADRLQALQERLF